VLPDGDRTNAIGALTGGRDQLVATRSALTNQLRGALDRF